MKSLPLIAAVAALVAGCGGEATRTNERAGSGQAGRGGEAAKVQGEASPKAKSARLNYVELPARDLAASRGFYEKAFGWAMTEFAPTYAATTTGDTDIGLDADRAEAPKAPLPVIQVPDLEAALRSVEAAGGKVTKPIFAFPGGRRFHFRDPSGNEVAAWQQQ